MKSQLSKTLEIHPIETIIFVRHGKTLQTNRSQYGRQNYAHIDPEYLSDLIQSQKKLQKIIPFGTPIFSAESLRCQETAQFIFERTASTIEGLKPYHSGNLEYLNFEEAESIHEQYLQKPVLERFTKCEQNEESITDQIRRIETCLHETFLANPEARKLILVTNESVMNIIGKITNNLCKPKEILTNRYESPYGGVQIFTKDAQTNFWEMQAA